MKWNSVFYARETSHYKIKLFRDIKKVDEIGVITTSFMERGNTLEILNEIDSAYSKEKSILEAAQFNLSPIAYKSRIDTASGTFLINAEYKKRKVVVTALTPRGKQNFTLDVPENSYDNSSSFYLFRAIVFNLIQVQRLYLLNLNIGSKILTDVRLAEEQERVKVPYGEFECVSLKLTFPDLPSAPIQRFLFNKEAPHFLVKNITGTQVIEVTNFNTG